MWYDYTCKSCNKKFKIKDLYLYPEDDDEDGYVYPLMAEKELCYFCFKREEELTQIKIISDLLDSFNEQQKELFIKFTELNYNKVKELLETHFKGEDGIRTWGLW